MHIVSLCIKRRVFPHESMHNNNNAVFRDLAVIIIFGGGYFVVLAGDTFPRKSHNIINY